MSLPERALATIRRHLLIPRGARVLAAVSGGADSVALALVLRRIAPELDATLAGLVHLNHQLRGAASDEDEAFVRSLALELDVPFLSRRVDVAQQAKDSRESIEAAARRVRYAFFDEAANQLQASLIATAHTADDQAETVLMRLMRGAGLEGLSAIRPRNGRVIRPLLDARRAEVLQLLESEKRPWREDASNADTAITRNRVRHLVMPALKAAAGEGAVDALARTASLIQDDAEELERVAIETARSIVLPDGTLDAGALANVSAAIARRVIRRALHDAAGGRFFSLEHVEGVRSLIREDASHAIELPGLRAVRAQGVIRIERVGAGEPPVPFESALLVPGVTQVPAAGMEVSAEVATLTAAAVRELRMAGDEVAVQGVEGARLTVRSRRPGDALRPLGGSGRRKVQDIFVDRKTARHLRDQVPLVVDDRGRIVWVVGHAIADEFRVTSPESRVLLLKVRRAGASRPGEFGGPV